jgi:APA family basic amino acid/polyamine antiporter
MWLLVVWLVMGAMALCGALCYGELSARYPEAGGGYVYLREAYGPAVAFMYGWMAFLVMDPGLTAALATGLATYAGYISNSRRAESKSSCDRNDHRRRLDQHSWCEAGRRIYAHYGDSQTRFARFCFLWGVGFNSATGPTSLHLSSGKLRSAHRRTCGRIIGAFFSFAGWWDLGKLAGEVRIPDARCRKH